MVRYKKHLFKILFAGCILLGVFVAKYGLSIDSLGGVESADNNIERQMQVFNTFSNEDYLSEKSTLFLTVFLLNEYAESGAYFTGPGNLLRSKNGYGGVVTVDEAMSDSQLALYFCETGIIGILFLVSMLYLIIKRCRVRIYAVAMVLYLLLVSITEYGLFEGFSAIYMLLTIESIKSRTNCKRSEERSYHILYESSICPIS